MFTVWCRGPAHFNKPISWKKEKGRSLQGRLWAPACRGCRVSAPLGQGQQQLLSLCPPARRRARLLLPQHPGREGNKDREQLLLFFQTFSGPIPPVRCCYPETPAATQRPRYAWSSLDTARPRAFATRLGEPSSCQHGQLPRLGHPTHRGQPLSPSALRSPEHGQTALGCSSTEAGAQPAPQPCGPVPLPSVCHAARREEGAEQVVSGSPALPPLLQITANPHHEESCLGCQRCRTAVNTGLMLGSGRKQAGLRLSRGRTSKPLIAP